ncbi:MAG: hypothetical protein ACOCYU_08635 [Brevefilum sp.]
MPSEPKSQKPRLIKLLTVFLLLQVPGLIFIGLNLLTQHWTFLLDFSVLWEDIREAFQLALATPGDVVGDEILLFSLIGFFVLLLGAGAALYAALTFRRGRPMAWIMSLVAQNAVLVTGIGLYFVYQPNQSYWLIAIGIFMVLYLNNAEVRQWFLRSWAGEELHGD